MRSLVRACRSELSLALALLLLCELLIDSFLLLDPCGAVLLRNCSMAGDDVRREEGPPRPLLDIEGRLEMLSRGLG